MASPARSILLASPPGQFDLILEDIKSIAPKAVAEESELSALRAEWAATTGHAIIEASAAEYAADESSDGCVHALRKAMDDYANLKFSSPGVRAAHQVNRKDGDEILTITTYAERIDLNNQHAGSWRGCYTVCPSSGTISGEISICAHTFENGGNVQLHSNITLDSINVGTASSSDGSDKHSTWAQAVKRQIQNWEEGEVMGKLSELYASIGNAYMKSLRRAMPITRVKMDWNVMAHRLVQTLGEGHDKEKFKH